MAIDTVPAVVAPVPFTVRHFVAESTVAVHWLLWVTCTPFALVRVHVVLPLTSRVVPVPLTVMLRSIVNVAGLPLTVMLVLAAFTLSVPSGFFANVAVGVPFHFKDQTVPSSC